MGGGSVRGPLGLSGEPSQIEDGTLARTGSPIPGAIGAHGKGGAKEAGHDPAPSAAAPAGAPHEVDYAAIVAYASQLIGHVDPNGECVALVDHALAAGGAASYTTLGPHGPNDNYVWGQPLMGLSQVRPGDVAQFSGYTCEWRWGAEDEDGNYTEQGDETESRPHHSAIVESVETMGAFTILEQNSPVGSPVTETQLYVLSQPLSETVDGVTTTITQQGSVTFYRPQPAASH